MREPECVAAAHKMEEEMTRYASTGLAFTLLALSFSLAQPVYGHGAEEHEAAPETGAALEHMRDMHKGHSHEHNFAAIEALSPEAMREVMDAMSDIGLAVPPMNAHQGRELFVDKGCIVCHQVNGVGGELGPSLNAADMPSPMNTFEFAARMWRGAGAMVQMQEELFGQQIEITGQELADLIAFAHDKAEQKQLSKDDIPQRFRELIE